jgi:FtsP/CotA-like multicopper oxidase with cupredoxin domain
MLASLNRRPWLRRLLLVGVAGALVVGAAIAGTGAWLYSGARTDTVGDLAFEQPLQIPPVLDPEIDAEGRKVFRLRLQEGTTELVPGRQTETWGANGSYLGPTLRASRGDEVAVHVDNDLPESTTLHWHGMHLPAAADGNPHQLIEPGASWSPSWGIDQPAATLWYHPHPHGQTADHVYRGVAGMFLIDDDSPLELPDDYGIDDVPLIVQDKRFGSDGSLDDSAPTFSSVGVLGDQILINGTHDPYFEATTSLVRFRVLNASNARVYNLGFADDRAYWLVGTDSGLLERPHGTTRVQLSPGERAEIVVEVDPGERAVLRSYSPELGVGFPQERFNGGDDTFDLLEIRGAEELADSGSLPETLVDIDAPTEDEAVESRTFELTSARTINGQEMDMGRIDQVVEVDTTEIWEVTNDHGAPHSFHPHLIHFLVLDIDGEAPPPKVQGWKDTIYVPPGSTIRIIARFEDYADPETPYMFHCHVLRHEDRGMMGQFVVVEPGDVDTASRSVGAEGRHEH